MKRFFVAALLTAAIATPTIGAAPTVKNPMVQIETTMGSITVELYRDKVQATVDNFLAYVDKKFFDGTIFHRVIPSFMIQGGGFTPDMVKKPTNAPIKLEAGKVSNLRGTIAMARTNVRDSATAQFFINVVDNQRLDSAGGGYAAFGKVVGSMDAVDKIRGVKTGSKNGMGDVPKDVVIIKSIRRVP